MKKKQKKHIPNNLRQIMLLRNITREEVATAINLSAAYVLMWELGYRNIAIKHLRKIADVLQCDSGDIIAENLDLNKFRDNPHKNRDLNYLSTPSKEELSFRVNPDEWSIAESSCGFMDAQHIKNSLHDIKNYDIIEPGSLKFNMPKEDTIIFSNWNAICEMMGIYHIKPTECTSVIINDDSMMPDIPTRSLLIVHVVDNLKLITQKKQLIAFTNNHKDVFVRECYVNMDGTVNIDAINAKYKSLTSIPRDRIQESLGMSVRMLGVVIFRGSSA